MKITVAIILSGAKSILGEPIKDVGLDIGEPNKADKVSAYFEVKASFQIKNIYSEYYSESFFDQLNSVLLGSRTEGDGNAFYMGL